MLLWLRSWNWNNSSWRTSWKRICVYSCTSATNSFRLLLVIRGSCLCLPNNFDIRRIFLNNYFNFIIITFTFYIIGKPFNFFILIIIKFFFLSIISSSFITINYNTIIITFFILISLTRRRYLLNLTLGKYKPFYWYSKLIY